MRRESTIESNSRLLTEDEAQEETQGAANHACSFWNGVPPLSNVRELEVEPVGYEDDVYRL